MLGDYELLRIDNGLIFRNGKTSESTSSIDLVQNAVLKDNGIKCTNNAIQNLDISSTLEYQGSENTLEFTLTTDSMRDAWDYSLVHVYLEGTESTGYVISVMSRGFGYESGDPFKTSISNYYQTSSYTCSDRNIKIAVKDKKCYFFVNDNLEYTTPELNITNKIVGICIKDRSDSRFYGVAVKDLVLTSNIKYGLDDGEEIEEPAEEVYIKQVSGNEFLRYDKDLNKVLTTRTNNSEETTIEDNCIVLNKSGSEKIEFNPAESSDYELSFTGFTDYCVRNRSYRACRTEFARINFSHGYYVSFQFYVASGTSGSISSADGLETHLYKGLTLVNNTAGLSLTSDKYPSGTYGTQLIGTDVVYKVIKKGNTVQFCYNDKILNVNVVEDIGQVKSVVFSGQSDYGAFKFSNIEYTDNEFNDRIFDLTKPEEIYIREDFTLTATVKDEFENENVEYLWDTGETTPSITLNKETEGLYSNSCTVSCGYLRKTKTIEYNVTENQNYKYKLVIGNTFKQSFDEPAKLTSENNEFEIPLKNAYISNNKLYVSSSTSETITFPNYGYLRTIEFDTNICDFSGSQFWTHHFYLNDGKKVVLGIGNTWMGFALVEGSKSYTSSGHIRRNDVAMPNTTSTFNSHIRLEITDQYLICSRTRSGIEYICKIDISDLDITNFTKAEINRNDNGSYYKTTIFIENLTLKYSIKYPYTINVYNENNEIAKDLYDNESYRLVFNTPIKIKTSSVKINDEIFECELSDNEITVNFANLHFGDYAADFSVNNVPISYDFIINKNDIFLKGKVIAFQNTISPNIFYNSFEDEVNSEIADISYFETNNNRLYFYSTSSSQTYKANYKTPSYNLRSFKNNVTIEYNLYCPRSTLRTMYPRDPIMNLRISETQYISVYKYSNSSNSNIFDEYLITSNGSGYTGSRYGYSENAFVTDNEAKVKIDITPNSVTLNIYFDGKTLTKVYNVTVDKKYLEFILFHKYGDNSTLNYLRTNTEFYISDFIAYETGYEITDEDKQAINELMVSQNNDYIAEHGATIIPELIIKFKDVPLEGEVCKTVTLDASQSTQENGFIKSYLWDTGETTSSITASYIDKTYTVTATGKGGKTSSKSITLKGIIPELDDHVMWKLNPYNAKYFYYRDKNGVNSGETKITGTPSIGSIISFKGNYPFSMSMNESNDAYNGSLVKLLLNAGYSNSMAIYFTNGYYISFSSSGNSIKLYNDKSVLISSASTDGWGNEKYIINLKGSIFELYQNGTLKIRCIIDLLNFEDFKFDYIKINVSSYNDYGSISLAEIQSFDVAEPNIEVISSNENAECFEDVALQIGADQPCDIVCNGEEYAGKFTKKYVETSLFSIKATNKLDNSLYKEIEYTQNIKELVNDINIKNELGLAKLYQNQNADAEYKLPTTLPKNAVIKYYIDGKEVK